MKRSSLLGEWGTHTQAIDHQLVSTHTQAIDDELVSTHTQAIDDQLVRTHTQASIQIDRKKEAGAICNW